MTLEDFGVTVDDQDDVDVDDRPKCAECGAEYSRLTVCEDGKSRCKTCRRKR